MKQIFLIIIIIMLFFRFFLFSLLSPFPFSFFLFFLALFICLLFQSSQSLQIIVSVSFSFLQPFLIRVFLPSLQLFAPLTRRDDFFISESALDIRFSSFFKDDLNQFWTVVHDSSMEDSLKVVIYSFTFLIFSIIFPIRVSLEAIGICSKAHKCLDQPGINNFLFFLLWFFLFFLLFFSVVIHLRIFLLNVFPNFFIKFFP